MSRHPEVLWAQRSSSTVPEKNIVYLTVNLPDIIESSLDYALTPTNLSFKATTGVDSQYAFDLDLYAEVDPENCTRRLTSRSLVAVLRKKEKESEYWPRLTKEKRKTPFIKTDFSKWVDEDEQDGKPDPEGEDFGGMGGIPGMDSDFDFSKMSSDFGSGSTPTKDLALDPESDDDDDDEDDGGPPPLEDTEPAK